MLAFPLFVICTKIHIVEKAVDSRLGVIVKAWEPQNDLGLEESASLSPPFRGWQQGQCFLCWRSRKVRFEACFYL